MKKDKSTAFFCQNCGNEFSKWMGQCPACGEWNSLVEETLKTVSKTSQVKRGRSTPAETVKISDVNADEGERISTGMEELDRVLGGGVVRNSLVLVGGDPGIGKSTILLQVMGKLSEKGHSCIYVSGEESARQIKLRADRMGAYTGGIELFCETDLSDIEELAGKRKPEFMVIDSIQTMYNESVSSAPGSVSQVRESTAVLMQIAKKLGITVFIVGHVTKEGVVAGPRVLEHMVDTVLYFEGDRHASYRILRGVKNRFGSTNEIGVFEMTQVGLKEVLNPSEYMLGGKPENVSGSIVTCAIEGTRPMLIEVQALVTRSNFAMPRRTAAALIA